MEYRKRRLPWILMVLGAVMMLGALVMLSQTRDVVQYTLPAPDVGENGEAIAALSESAQKLGTTMKDSLAWVALSGSAGKATVSAGNASEEANLVAMDQGWLEVYPRFQVDGRRIGESELEQGALVIMLDEDLAFKLFGTDLPENATVKLNSADYRVVGTVRHGGSLFGGRGVGDTVPYDAYIPLASIMKGGVTLESLTLSAVPQGSAGAAMMFREAAEQWQPGGQIIDLQKESMRRTILPRIVLLIVGLYALIGLFKRATDLVMGWFEGFRQALKVSYFKSLIPRLLGIIALSLLIYGALIGVTYLLMAFSVQPLYVFTEWVPENLVEWSSIRKVFWNLTSQAAELVRIGTRELRVVEFWGGLVRWGMVLLLLGAALLPKAKREKR